MRRAIAHFAERDDASGFLERRHSMLSELPLLQFILPKVHRSKTMPFKQSSLKLINCMLDLIKVREVKREK